MAEESLLDEDMTEDVINASSPLFPIASRTHRRAVLAAESLGLVCVPATYPLQWQANGGSVRTLTLNVPQSEGALVITDVQPPRSSQHAAQAMRVMIQSEWMEDTALWTYDSIRAPREYCGRLPSSPWCVDGGAACVFYFESENSYVAGEGIQVIGLSVRSLSPNGLVAAPMGLCSEWMRRVRHAGQRWGIAVEASSSGQPAPETITDNAIVECVVVSHAAAAVEGQQLPTDIKIKVGSLYLTPGLPGALMSPEVDGRRALVMPGLKWPVRRGDQVTVQLAYTGSGTNLPVRFSLLGRRGGIAGECW